VKAIRVQWCPAALPGTVSSNGLFEQFFRMHFDSESSSTKIEPRTLNRDLEVTSSRVFSSLRDLEVASSRVFSSLLDLEVAGG
jgi:hypothetical protein